MSRLRSKDHVAAWDETMRRRAVVRGKTIYKGIECNRVGHGRRRYVATTGCVVCSDARAAKKDRKKAPRGVSGTPEYRLWMGARNRAAERGLDFTIAITDIRIPTVCPVLGTPMDSPSLDRFDNDRGYTPENVRVISRRANTIKSDATLSEILAVARYMAGGDEFDALLG